MRCYSESRILAARVDARFQAIQVRSEPKQIPPYRPLPEVIKEQQIINTFTDVDGTLIGFRFPAAASSANIAGWHFHFLSVDKARGGHVITLNTATGRAWLEEISARTQSKRWSGRAEATRVRQVVLTQTLLRSRR
jgi:acetolactate decarboxylase